jgi:hypothetical protein
VNEQVDANTVIQSLLRQLMDYAQKVALLEAMLEKMKIGLETDNGN